MLSVETQQLIRCCGILQLNLEDQELLCEIHDLQEKVGFGNPSF